MEKEDKYLLEKPLKVRKHPLRQKLLAGFLCICLMVVSMPMGYGTGLVLAAQKQEIIVFEELAQDVKVQNVEMGTPLEELGLPNKLAVTCRQIEEASAISPSDAAQQIGGSEPAIIEEVTWESSPEYSGKMEGVYVFTPILPEQYTLAEGLELPKINVAVRDGELSRGIEKEEGKEQNFAGKKAKDEKESLDKLEEVQEEWQELYAAKTTPSCGTISEDTTWESGTLTNGELIVEPGVTLTLNGILNISGSVTIRGGGTIVRGNSNVIINVYSGKTLIIQDITIDGKDMQSYYTMLNVRGNLKLNDGAKIINCRNDDIAAMGGAIFISEGTAELNNAVIENCSSSYLGGGIYFLNSVVKINGGTYRNNKTTKMRYEDSACGGGFLFNASSKLYIYGGNFISNSTIARGGAIYHNGYSATETHIYGGVFQGNTSSWEPYAGSGAIWHSSIANEANILDISGNVHFCGDGTNSGVDGIYLDSRNNMPRKLMISNTLSYPLKVYVKPIEGYVIAEGINDYILLHERDMKKINFVDISGSGKKWYAVLDEKTNQVKISENDPGYGYYVYYISNGAQGTVVDNGRYQIGDITQVKAADPLQWEGHTFLEWNTEPDGKGKGYQPGENLNIEGDTDLYAIFEENEKKIFRANFYSGNGCEKETIPILLEEPETSGTVEIPEPKELEGFTFIGWEEENPLGYIGEIKPGQEVTLTKEETNFYAVYQKDVTLSYVAEGVEQAPGSEVKPYLANVHEEISYQEPEFTIAQGPQLEGYTFVGWNTDPDGNGDTYPEGSIEKFTEDATLYARYTQKKVFAADFYSGSAGSKERLFELVEESALSVEITAPELKEMEGWEPVGWDANTDSYAGDVSPGTALALTEPLQEYYGIYKKDIQLFYDLNGAEGKIEPDLGQCLANVHEEVTYQIPEFTIASTPSRPGYLFQGWNTLPDGSGEDAPIGSVQSYGQDTALYAIWQEDERADTYQVEHYKQDLEGDGYTKEDAGTEVLSGMKGKEVEASPKEYAGFHFNSAHPSNALSGKLQGDGKLVLQMYYDRDVYTVDFDLNGGYGTKPDTQKVRYGGLVKGVEEPAKAGYSFKGWHLEDNGLDGGLWDFTSPVEANTASLETTLYAKWADELAPQMGEAAFGTEYKDFLNWLIKKENLVITVPVLEEGSGMKRAEYTLIPEQGEEKSGEAQVTEQHGLSSQSMAYGSGASVLRALQGEAESGKYYAAVTIDEDFKGKVRLTCIDNAGNVSATKTLTAMGGGVVVEDNAPTITFSSTQDRMADETVDIDVLVEDSKNGEVSGGIAEVGYQIDQEEVVKLPKEDFQGGMVESYRFTLNLSGEGKHTVKVYAKDNAGNENTQEISIALYVKKEKISEREERNGSDGNLEIGNFKKPGNPGKPSVPDNPGKPSVPGSPFQGEPRTGGGSQVKIYATAAMVAGFGYLLLYFEGEHGITKEKKEEIVYRLIAWAKKGGMVRRYLGLLVIFLFLAYYHSIGKSVAVEWREVCVIKERKDSVS